VWLPDPYRATRDIDLLAFGASDEAAVRSLIEEVCAVPYAEDGLSFDLSELSVETIRAEEEYPGSRARFLAHLGTARIHIQVDVGYGDSVRAECEEIQYPVLLDHLPAPQLRAYPKETTVAESSRPWSNWISATAA